MDLFPIERAHTILAHPGREQLGGGGETPVVAYLITLTPTPALSLKGEGVLKLVLVADADNYLITALPLPWRALCAWR